MVKDDYSNIAVVDWDEDQDHSYYELECGCVRIVTHTFVGSTIVDTKTTYNQWHCTTGHGNFNQ